MNTQNSKTTIDVEAIINAALARRAHDERVAYLDGACGDDVGLRSRVEALVQAHEEAGNFLVDATTERPIE